MRSIFPLSLLCWLIYDICIRFAQFYQCLLRCRCQWSRDVLFILYQWALTVTSSGHILIYLKCKLCTIFVMWGLIFFLLFLTFCTYLKLLTELEYSSSTFLVFGILENIQQQKIVFNFQNLALTSKHRLKGHEIAESGELLPK